MIKVLTPRDRDPEFTAKAPVKGRGQARAATPARG